MCVWNELGVALTVTSMAPFGSQHKKPPRILHNLPNGELIGDLHDYSLKLQILRGRVFYNGRWYWRTRLAEVYPPQWGVRYGLVVRRALDMRKRWILLKMPVQLANKKFEGFP